MRREAQTIRVEVRDLHRRPCRSRAAKLGTACSGVAGEGESTPTKPGRVSTTRWRGSGERDEKEYAGNQCYAIRLDRRQMSGMRCERARSGPGCAGARSFRLGALPHTVQEVAAPRSPHPALTKVT